MKEMTHKKSNYRRKMQAKENTKPKADVSQLALRTCLFKQSSACLGTFKSTSPGQRCCPKCRSIVQGMGGGFDFASYVK